MIKATRKTENVVSISWADVVTLVRQHLNQYGSREAGIHISIPESARCIINDHRDGEGTIITDSMDFHWISAE